MTTLFATDPRATIHSFRGNQLIRTSVGTRLLHLLDGENGTLLRVWRAPSSIVNVTTTTGGGGGAEPLLVTCQNGQVWSWNGAAFKEDGGGGGVVESANKRARRVVSVLPRVVPLEDDMQCLVSASQPLVLALPVMGSTEECFCCFAHSPAMLHVCRRDEQVVAFEFSHPVLSMISLCARQTPRSLLERLLGPHFLVDRDALVVALGDGSLVVTFHRAPKGAMHVVLPPGGSPIVFLGRAAAAAEGVPVIVVNFRNGSVAIIHPAGIKMYSTGFPVASAACQGSTLVVCDASMQMRPLVFDFTDLPARGMVAREVAPSGVHAAGVSSSAAFCGAVLWLLGVEGALRRYSVQNVHASGPVTLGSLQGLSVTDAMNTLVKRSEHVGRLQHEHTVANQRLADLNAAVRVMSGGGGFESTCNVRVRASGSLSFEVCVCNGRVALSSSWSVVVRLCAAVSGALVVERCFRLIRGLPVGVSAFVDVDSLELSTSLACRCTVALRYDAGTWVSKPVVLSSHLFDHFDWQWKAPHPATERVFLAHREGCILHSGSGDVVVAHVPRIFRFVLADGASLSFDSLLSWRSLESAFGTRFQVAPSVLSPSECTLSGPDTSELITMRAAFLRHLDKLLAPHRVADHWKVFYAQLSRKELKALSQRCSVMMTMLVEQTKEVELSISSILKAEQLVVDVVQLYYQLRNKTSVIW